MRFTKFARLASLGGVVAASMAVEAGACPIDSAPLSSAPADANISVPVIEDAGFERGRLWIRLEPRKGPQPEFVLEPVDGEPPAAVAEVYGRPIAAPGDLLQIPIDEVEPFAFGFRVRAVAEGQRGDPSPPTWLSYALTDEGPSPGLRSDQVLFVLLVFGLGLIWYWYKREPGAESKIRLAALSALVSVVFLSLTSAMSWLTVEGESARIACRLGEEGSCLLGAARAPIDLDLLTASFEVQRWQCASAALRMGQVTALALLLPALIWLLVDPRNRAAQAATAVGASVGGFTLLVALLYRHSVPSWLEAEMSWTSDIALVTSSHIVIAAVLVVRQSFALITEPDRIPRATLRRG